MTVWCLSRRGSSCAGSSETWRVGLSAIGGARVVTYWNGSAAGPAPSLRGVGGSGVLRLPAGLAHAGQLAGVGHLPQADPAQAELAEDRVRATAALASGVAADRELRLAGRLVDESLLGHLCCLLPRLSGSCSRRSDRRRGTRAGGAARDPPRRSWRW